MIIYKTVSILGSTSSIIGLAFISANIPSTGKLIFILIGILSMLYCIISTYNDYKNNKIIRCKNKLEIKYYMLNWIKTDGRVNVFSRDLSWVDDEIKALMKNKSSDLHICAEKENNLTKELSSSGVIIYYYDKLSYKPKSRFTIIRANKDDSQVAIATSISHANNSVHKIYETKGIDNRDKWLKVLSADMFEFIRAFNDDMSKKQN